MEVTIEDGVDGGVIEDNTIVDASNSTYNFGAWTEMDVNDNRHFMIKIDLTGYSGVTVSSAKFGIDIYSATAMNIGWHKILVAWVEGTKVGATEIGSSCWDYRVYNTVPWNTAGCGGDGVDRETTPEGTADITGVDSDFALDMTNVTVQDWLDNPSNNNGVMSERKSGGTNPNRIRSSESTLGNKPYFYMEYTEAVSIYGVPRNKIVNFGGV